LLECAFDLPFERSNVLGSRLKHDVPTSEKGRNPDKTERFEGLAQYGHSNDPPGAGIYGT